MKNRQKINFALYAAMALLVSSAVTTPALSKKEDPYKAILNIQGTGAHPNSSVYLSTGPQQKLAAKADFRGNFVFENLAFSSFTPLTFSLDLPEAKKGKASFPATNFEITYDPIGSSVHLKGKISPAGNVVLNMAGSQKSLSQIAGESGLINMKTRVSVPLSRGNSELMASIINVGEACCPKIIVPATPMTIKISGVSAPKQVIPMENPAKAVKSAPAIPYIIPFSKPNSEETAPAEKAVPDTTPKPVKKVPYIVYDEVSENLVVEDVVTSAVSFPPGSYESTYVGGYKKLADQLRDTIISVARQTGQFIDGYEINESIHALQKQNVTAMQNYAPSGSVCRYGTLSRSLVGTDSVVNANRLVFSKMLQDRQHQKKGVMYSDPAVGLKTIVLDFQGHYCFPDNNNSFLKGYCKALAAVPDKYFDRDVDFTRVFDVPLTVNADFTNSAAASDEQKALTALFANLSFVPPYMDKNGAALSSKSLVNNTQNIRALGAARQIAENSMAALVSQKVKGKAESATYMHAVLKQLGLSDADAKKLIGDNPSYYAQMEVLTKKLFQDPAFYANLYDSPVNVDRQKVAITAIALQQDRDFLEGLRRKEMLLSALLELKIRNAAGYADQAGVVATKQR